MMILDDLQEFIDTAKCPETFPEEVNIGSWMLGDDDEGDKLFEFYPQDSCDAFAHIQKYHDDAYIKIHSHGISIQIDDTKINIHNSQIFVFDFWHFDDTIEYKKSDSRGARVALGTMLGGPIVGAAIGLATSFGKGKKHLKRDNLVIGFWDIKTRTKQIINLQEGNDSQSGSVKRMIDFWKEQVQINKETGREPVGKDIAGVSEASGCMTLLIIGLSSLFVAMYTLIEMTLC